MPANHSITNVLSPNLQYQMEETRGYMITDLVLRQRINEIKRSNEEVAEG